MNVDPFDNIVMMRGSYKVTHFLQCPPGTTKVYSCFESRGGLYSDVCFFGLQYFMKRYMIGQTVTMEKIAAADEHFKIHFSHPKWGYDPRIFNRAAWEHIVKSMLAEDLELAAEKSESRFGAWMPERSKTRRQSLDELVGLMDLDLQSDKIQVVDLFFKSACEAPFGQGQPLVEPRPEGERVTLAEPLWQRCQPWR